MSKHFIRKIGSLETNCPNPMLQPIEINQIKSLYQAGVPIKQIVAQTGIVRNTVRKYLREMSSSPSTNSRHIIESFGAEIREMFFKCEGNCVVVHRNVESKLGLHVSLRQLQRFCHPFRKDLKPDNKHIRFETEPGQQMQIDFAEKTLVINGEVVKMHFFVAVLGYSRRIFAKAFPVETQSSWLDGIESAFRFFDGVPLVLLSDNSRCLITEHRQKGSYKFTSGYFHFCNYWNIKPIASSPYHPQSKGKVERAVRYLKENALVGQDFQSLTQLNQWLECWSLTYADNRELDDLIEGLKTPKERFWIEKNALRSFDRPRIAAIREETRKVDGAGLIRIDNNFYRLPSELINKDVQILVDDSTVIVSRKGVFVAELDKATSVYRPSLQKEQETKKFTELPTPLEAYTRNTLQRPLKEYEKITGGSWS